MTTKQVFSILEPHLVNLSGRYQSFRSRDLCVGGKFEPTAAFQKRG